VSAFGRTEHRTDIALCCDARHRDVRPAIVSP
jgi:hypothetical protein